MAGRSLSDPACRAAVEAAAPPVPPPARIPGSGPFARLLTALLSTQLGAGPGRKRADALRESLGLELETFVAADTVELAAALSDRGDAARARKLAAQARALAVAVARLGGEAALDALPDEAIRDELRGVRGLGPATVDTLLAALVRAVAPVTRPAYRILVRHGWIEESAGYDEARSILEAAAPDDAPALGRLVAGMETIGSRWCKPGRPRCESCPLAPWLPPCGPLQGSEDAGE